MLLQYSCVPWFKPIPPSLNKCNFTHEIPIGHEPECKPSMGTFLSFKIQKNKQWIVYKLQLFSNAVISVGNEEDHITLGVMILRKWKVILKIMENCIYGKKKQWAYLVFREIEQETSYDEKFEISSSKETPIFCCILKF